MRLSLYDRYKPAGIRGGGRISPNLEMGALCQCIQGTVHCAVSPKPVALHRRSFIGNSVFLPRVKEAKGKQGVTVRGTTDSTYRKVVRVGRCAAVEL